jgi:hypothetical protein
MEHSLSLPKLRNLDKFGVLADPDPFDLPLGAWSMAVNVRFEDGKITSAPVWRAVASPLLDTSPRYVYVANKADSSTSIYVGYLNGLVSDWSPTSETPVSPTGYTASTAEAAWTGTTLAGVVYINREDRLPWAMRPADTKFSTVIGWDANWRAKVIRAYASAICAFNITKSGVRYPTMVKTSDLVTDPGAEPPSWDNSLTTNNATENLLTEMNGEIVEAQTLGNSLILYSAQETWSMTADGSSNVYSYRKLPFSAGAINTNCVVEVNNRHYVFGADDIWMHDGLSQSSIVDGKNRKFIFKSLNAKKSNRFFVTYDPSKKTISFNYVSGDPWVKFNGNGCNRAAVYHLSNGTWTFDDVPLAFASGYAKVSLATLTWANVTATWSTIGGSWQDLEDGFKRTTVYVGENGSGLTARVYARDLYGNASNLTSVVDEVATQPALLLREGMDLDELDAELRGYKIILAIYPQGRLDPSAAPMEFSFGVTDYPNVPAVFSAPQTYDALENYKLDFTEAGRFLSMRMDYPDYKTMSLSGIDVDLDVLGSR